MIDYKINKIIRDGKQTKVVISFYIGDITTEKEMDSDTGKLVDITRYRRIKKLGTKTITFSGNIAPSKDLEDEYLRRFLNEKLKAKSDIEKQIPITEQSKLETYNKITIINEINA